ncbi:hypothetical protein ABK040_005246 [Willaertia magna]
MPKYYCDYCDVFLTNDSPGVRKLHNNGWKHKTNVRAYYAQFVDDPTSALMTNQSSNNLNNQQQNINPLQFMNQQNPTTLFTPIVPGLFQFNNLNTINQQLQQQQLSTTTTSSSITLPSKDNKLNGTTTNQQTVLIVSSSINPSNAATNKVQSDDVQQQQYGTTLNHSLQASSSVTPSSLFQPPPFSLPPKEFFPSNYLPIQQVNNEKGGAMMVDSEEECIEEQLRGLRLPKECEDVSMLLFPPPIPPHLLAFTGNIPVAGTSNAFIPPPPLPYTFHQQQTITTTQRK